MKNAQNTVKKVTFCVKKLTPFDIFFTVDKCDKIYYKSFHKFT